MAKTKTEDRPYVANYPPLAEWLAKIEARCDWQLPIGPKNDPNAYVECYSAPHGNRHPFIVIVYAHNHGWNIFTDERTNKIAATFEDAELRLGLAPAPKPSEEGGVSPTWVLNQLAGMTFPSQGGAYDFMKRCLYSMGVSTVPPTTMPVVQGAADYAAAQAEPSKDKS